MAVVFASIAAQPLASSLRQLVSEMTHYVSLNTTHSLTPASPPYK